MEHYRINQKVKILRKNGNIQMARILILNADDNLVTVEWVEGDIHKTKEVPLEVLQEKNLNESMRYPSMERIPPPPSRPKFAREQGNPDDQDDIIIVQRTRRRRQVAEINEGMKTLKLTYNSKS
ncbi:hypothetical protein KR074_009199 [Drosophila pseudoananassae]|nr:hypothetical protein KR074_009199 [Drosophila pseudoananassae]